MDVINLAQAFDQIDQPWHPHVAGALNGQHVKLVKLLGTFVWHQHEHEDELFLVVKGQFWMEFRDKRVLVQQGEYLIVPRATEHRPVADEEACVLLFEPASTVNTGSSINEHTRTNLPSIQPV